MELTFANAENTSSGVVKENITMKNIANMKYGMQKSLVATSIRFQERMIASRPSSVGAYRGVFEFGILTRMTTPVFRNTDT